MWNYKLFSNAGKMFFTGRNFPWMIPKTFPVGDGWQLRWVWQYARQFARKQIWLNMALVFAYSSLSCFPIALPVSLHSPDAYYHKHTWSQPIMKTYQVLILVDTLAQNGSLSGLSCNSSGFRVFHNFFYDCFSSSSMETTVVITISNDIKLYDKISH